MRRGDPRHRRVPRELLHAVATEWPVCDEENVIVAAVLGDTVSQVLIVEWRQTHLNRADRRDRASRLDLPDGDVAQADVANDAVVAQPRERSDARLDRR